MSYDSYIIINTRQCWINSHISISATRGDAEGLHPPKKLLIAPPLIEMVYINKEFNK